MTEQEAINSIGNVWQSAIFYQSVDISELSESELQILEIINNPNNN